MRTIGTNIKSKQCIHAVAHQTSNYEINADAHAANGDQCVRCDTRTHIHHTSISLRDFSASIKFIEFDHVTDSLSLFACFIVSFCCCCVALGSPLLDVCNVLHTYKSIHAF